MGRLRLVCVCAVAAFLLSAVGAQAATNHYWMVNGKQLATGIANGKEVELVSNSPIVFTIKTPSFQVECKKLEYIKEGSPALIWNEVKGGTVIGRDEGDLNSTECTDLTQPSCKVVEPVSSRNKSEVSTTLVEDSANKKIYDMFLPEGWVEGTAAESEKERLFWEWDQTPAPCLTNVPIEGDGLAGRIPEETKEAETHKIELPGESTRCTPVGAPIGSVVMANGNTIKLRFKGNHILAQECGEATARLVSKEAWSVK